jgi:hypothetical protein
MCVFKKGSCTYPLLLMVEWVSIFFRRLYQQLGGSDVLDFYQRIIKTNYHFCYINQKKNIIINCVEQLLHNKSVEMFVNHTIFVIHSKDAPCSLSVSNDHNDNLSVKQQLNEFILLTYPKQKFLNIVCNTLTKNNLINSDLCFTDFDSIHIADFLSYINNKFNKGHSDPRIIKLCKLLQNKQLRFPNVSVKNPAAKKYLC